MNAANRLLLLVEDPDYPALGTCANAAMVAADLFGQCELAASSGDRGSALDLGRGRLRPIGAGVARYNALGLHALARAKDGLADIRKELASEPSPGLSQQEQKALNEVLDAHSSDLAWLLADLDIKGSDAQKIHAELVSVVKEAKRGGELGLLALLEAKLKELEGARNRSDRGVKDNIPWWKLLVIAIALAIDVWIIYRCMVKKRKKACGKVEAAALEAVTTIAALVAYYC